jgi:hypothetical protein
MEHPVLLFSSVRGSIAFLMILAAFSSAFHAHRHDYESPYQRAEQTARGRIACERAHASREHPAQKARPRPATAPKNNPINMFNVGLIISPPLSTVNRKSSFEFRSCPIYRALYPLSFNLHPYPSAQRHAILYIFTSLLLYIFS